MAAGALAATLLAVAAAVAFAAPSKPLSLSDPSADTTGPLDVQRFQLSRAKDGHLRAVLTFTSAVTAKSMLAPGGPPGSACLRIWSLADADPAAMRPNLLVCVTARDEDEIRGGVYEQTGPGLPKRIGDASAKLNTSGRSLVIRASQSSLGSPQLIRVAAETTRPGCGRANCVDTVPDGGSTRRFRLR